MPRIPVESPVRQIEAHKTINGGVAVTMVMDADWLKDVDHAIAMAEQAFREVAALLSETVSDPS